MNKKLAAQVTIIIVAVIVVLSAVYLYLPTQQLPQQELQPQTFYCDENTIFRIDESGNAEAEWSMEMSPSVFTDLTIIGITGGTMDNTAVHGIGIENAKLMYISELQSSYAYYSWEMDNVSCYMPELEIGGSFRISARWKAPHVAYRKEGKWDILMEPISENDYSQHVLNDIKSIQANISLASRVLSKDCRLVYTSSVVYVLPDGAEITNLEDLQTLKGSIDYGGGTIENSDVYTSEIEGRTTVVLESRLTIGTRLISISEGEFLERTKFVSIEYTGVPYPEDFEDSAAWVMLDMKFGRERDSYTVSFSGVELDISPCQLLYYSAKDVVILSENSGERLLTGDRPIQVSPPDNESGEWGAFLRTLSREDLVNLAIHVRDSIDSTGEAPSTIVTSIGSLRFRDVLFTFLRTISFYQEHGDLPDNLTFAPAPTGNLTKSGVEIPASLVYLTLGEKYVITGTQRVNQILSDLWQPYFSESRFAENICEWVYRNIVYPVPVILGWFTSEEVLDMRIGKCLDKANLYMALTRTAGIPTRRITGFLIFDQVSYPFMDIAGITPDGKYILGHAWTEVYVPEGGWLFADPTTGYFKINRYDVEVYSKVEETWQQVLASYETAYGKLI